MENYNFIYIIFDLVLTISLYMIFPLIFKLFHKGKIESKKAKKVAIINSIVLALFFVIFREILGVEDGNYNFAPAFFYYFINKIILEMKEGNKTPLFVLILICIGCFIVGLFIAYIIYWSISLISLIAIIIYLVKDKKQGNKGINHFTCSECGAKVEKDSLFCSKCGEKFTGVYKTEEKDEIEEKVATKKNENVAIENLKVKKKAIYCKNCGGKLNDDKKCTKCGKQYFKLSKTIILYIVIGILVLTNVITLLLYNDIRRDYGYFIDGDYYEDVEEEIINTCGTALEQISNKRKINFLDDYIVIVPGDSKYYYSYDCYIEHYSNYDFYAYNVDNAIAQGYKKGTC